MKPNKTWNFIDAITCQMSEIFYDEVNGNKDTRSDFLLKEAICDMIFLF